MRQGMRWLGGLAVLVLLAGAAQAATTWTVVTNQDCTGVGAPAGCCTAAGQGYCNRIKAAGNEMMVFATFAANSGATYTTNGDTPAVTQLAKLGLNMLLPGQVCRESVGRTPVLVRSSTPLDVSGHASSSTLKIVLYNSGNTQVGSGDSITLETVECQLFGY